MSVRNSGLKHTIRLGSFVIWISQRVGIPASECRLPVRVSQIEPQHVMIATGATIANQSAALILFSAQIPLATRLRSIDSLRPVDHQAPAGGSLKSPHHHPTDPSCRRRTSSGVVRMRWRTGESPMRLTVVAASARSSTPPRKSVSAMVSTPTSPSESGIEVVALWWLTSWNARPIARYSLASGVPRSSMIRPALAMSLQEKPTLR